MSLTTTPKYGGSIGSSNNNGIIKEIYQVTDIILDNKHPRYQNEEDIYRIYFRDEVRGGAESSAVPLNPYHFIVPHIGEFVEVKLFPKGNTYSPELGGDPSFRENYYTDVIPVHNSINNNSLFKGETAKKKSTDKLKNAELGGGNPEFQYQKEFKSSSQSLVNKICNKYLRDLGYSSGRNDPRAPKYTLFQDNSTNGYILRLDDSSENKQKAKKLGSYFKENPNARPAFVTEGSVNIQGRNRQGIHLTSTTPEGITPWSGGTTDVDGDGNPNVGDPAMLFRVGNPYDWNGETEMPNINKDASSIYMFSNQKLENFEPSCTNFESRNATYQEVQDPFDIISNPPTVEVDEYDEDLSPVDPNDYFVSESSPIIVESTTDYSQIVTSSATPSNLTGDPVFDALDESADEGLLTYDEITIEDGDFEIIYGTAGDTFSPTYNVNNGSPTAPLFDLAGKNIEPITSLIYPTIKGAIPNANGIAPYNNDNNQGYSEFGGYRGVYTEGKNKGNNRWHWGVDIKRLNGEGVDLLAIDDGEVIFKRGDTTNGFGCTVGNRSCGGAYGNHLVIRLNSNPNYAALYAHCVANSTTLKKGDSVKKGDTIAIMGNTGRSGGIHLHFEIIEDPSGNQFKKNIWNTIYSKSNKRNPASLFPLMTKGGSYNFTSNS